ncbi:hypothetical protein C8Q78DRAFT_795036 [Trametes maxima]|nr:hypothetical protein C8Q78DRAFT_795036 [Trametes maxima]
MADRTTRIDYTNTPASEQSVYFDAPVVNWHKQSPDGVPSAPGPSVAENEATFPGAFELDSPKSVSRHPSISTGVPRDPIVRKGPADVDEEEAPNQMPTPKTADQGEPSSPLSGSSTHRRSTSAPTSDSGYGSAGGPRRPQSSTSEASTGIEPVPILWTESSPSQEAHHRAQAWQRSIDDDDDGQGGRPAGRRQDSQFKRASSLRSFQTSVVSGAGGRDRDGSVRTAPSILRRRRVSLSGGSFASGAGTVGPAASPVMDDSFDARSRSAEMSLSEKLVAKLNKTQIKEGKKVVKVIKAEGKAEKKALDEAVKELADIQKLQKAAVKVARSRSTHYSNGAKHQGCQQEEAKSYSSYAKVLREFHKAELEFFAARAKYERAQADLQAHEDAREASKQHAAEATEMLQEKNREVEWLRAQKAVDDLEREAKIRQLAGKA